MARSAARVGSLLLSLAVSAVGSRAAAEAGDESFSLDENEGTETAPAAAPDEPEKEAMLLSDEQALEEEKAPDEQYRSSIDPYEDPNKGYFFAGADWRYAVIPS